MYLPDRIRKKVDKLAYGINSVGMSGASVLCYDDMVLKIGRDAEDHERSKAMLSYLEGKLPAPRIIEECEENGLCYMLMTRIKGKMACAGEYTDNAAELLPILADGIKLLWRVDTHGCPQQNMLDTKLAHARRSVELGLCDEDNVQPGTYGPDGFSSPKELYAWLAANRPDEERAFSHGDLCLPNVFIDGGRISGFIDLGWAGVTDIYQDIALCYRSLVNNRDGKYGMAHPYFDAGALFSLLDIEPDRDKLYYYTMLDELF